MNLLIVNDEVLTADTMKADIDWKSYGVEQVYVAYSADDAKKCMTEVRIDILLCDIEMPEENGISLCRWVREHEKQTECIFLTCHANFEYAREAIELGCRNYILIPAKYEEIGTEVKRVALEIQQQRENKRYQEYGRQAVHDKTSHIIEQFGEKKAPEELVMETVKYIHAHIGEAELSVNEIAEKLYMHPVYLNRVFKNEKNTSIGKYMIGERMEMAAGLLKDGRICANIVAQQVGYNSYPSFNTMFKKYFGCTPAQYQEEHK